MQPRKHPWQEKDKLEVLRKVEMYGKSETFWKQSHCSALPRRPNRQLYVKSWIAGFLLHLTQRLPLMGQEPKYIPYPYRKWGREGEREREREKERDKEKKGKQEEEEIKGGEGRGRKEI